MQCIPRRVFMTNSCCLFALMRRKSLKSSSACTLVADPLSARVVSLFSHSRNPRPNNSPRSTDFCGCCLLFFCRSGICNVGGASAKPTCMCHFNPVCFGLVYRTARSISAFEMKFRAENLMTFAEKTKSVREDRKSRGPFGSFNVFKRTGATKIAKHENCKRLETSTESFSLKETM